MKFLIIIGCIALTRAQLFGKTSPRQVVSEQVVSEQVVSEIEPKSQPIPYSFSYSADATDGSSSRQESSDTSGVVRGSYSLVSADGLKRVVNYIADDKGFRAQVQTNEPGTESKSPADVVVQSSQLPAEEIALRVGPRPDEVKPQIQSFGLKTVEQNSFLPNLRAQNNAFVIARPVIDQNIFQQRVLSEIPVQKKVEAVVLPESFGQIVSSFQLTPKQVDTPIRLLSKIPRIQGFRSGEVQKKEEFIPQNFEQF